MLKVARQQADTRLWKLGRFKLQIVDELILALQFPLVGDPVWLLVVVEQEELGLEEVCSRAELAKLEVLTFMRYFALLGSFTAAVFGWERLALEDREQASVVQVIAAFWAAPSCVEG